MMRSLGSVRILIISIWEASRNRQVSSVLLTIGMIKRNGFYFILFYLKLNDLPEIFFTFRAFVFSVLKSVQDEGNPAH